MLLFITLLGKTRALFRRIGLLGALVAVLALGAWLFAVFDHRSFGTALYWAITTASTVGYGDVVPTTPAGRIVAAGVMVTAVPLLGLVFANAASYASELRMRRWLGTGGRAPMRDHVLVLGWNPRARVATRELLAAGAQVVLVADTSALPLDDPGVWFVRGDPTDEEVLRQAAPEAARAALIALDDDGQALIAAIQLRHLAPSLVMAAVTRSERTEAALRDLGVQAAVPVDALVGHALAKSVETPHAGAVLLRLVDSETYRIRERPVAPDEIGRPLSAVRAESRAGLVLGMVRGDAVRLGVLADVVLEAGDMVLWIDGSSSS
jgi:voltage-gated potassium channel